MAHLAVLLSIVNDTTKIIPGHGALSNAKELRAYRQVLVSVRDRVHKLVGDGKTRDEAITAKPSAEFDEKWGGGFMQPDVWVGIVYDGVIAEHEKDKEGP